MVHLVSIISIVLCKSSTPIVIELSYTNTSIFHNFTLPLLQVVIHENNFCEKKDIISVGSGVFMYNVKVITLKF